MNSKAIKSLLKSIPGIPDYTEDDHWLLTKFLEIIRSTYQCAGYRSLHASPFIKRDFLGKEISKQIYGLYRMADGGHTNLALPYDRTIPMAIWLARNLKSVVFPYKRMDISQSFRVNGHK